MRILITGSNGLLGQTLQRELQQQHEIFGVDLTKISYFNTRIKYLPLDITSRNETFSCFRQYNPQLVIHTAAMTAVDLCEIKKNQCWEVNVIGTENVVLAAERVGAKIVFISTDYIFDGKKGPYTEEDLPNPINYYGKSKLAAENIIRGSLISWVILRTIVLYGHGIKVNASFVSWLLNQLRNGNNVNIVNDQWGNTTLVDILAAAIISSIDHNAKGIYNIGGIDFMNRYEMALHVAEKFNLNPELISPIKTSELLQPASRPLKSGLFVEKAAKDLELEFPDIIQSLSIYKEQEEFSKDW